MWAYNYEEKEKEEAKEFAWVARPIAWELIPFITHLVGEGC